MESTPPLAKLATDIIAAYVSKNDVPRSELPKLIHEVFEALAAAMDGKKPVTSATQSTTKKTIFPDYLICLEDGKRFKSLKRHLRTAYKLSPEQYRAKWNLNAEYPMVAPNYAKTRSTLARSSGLGQKSAKQK